MLSRSSHTLLHRLTRPSTLALASGSIALAYVASSSSISNPFSLATLGQSNSMSSSSHDYPVKKSDDEWRLQLTPEQFRVSFAESSAGFDTDAPPCLSLFRS